METKISVAHIKDKLKNHLYPDFPKKDMVFLDIFPLLRDRNIFKTLVDDLYHQMTSHRIVNAPSERIDTVVALEARGFIFGSALAVLLGAGIVPIRKRGKLPGKCESISYEKEYGLDFFEIQSGAIEPGQNVVVVDDVLATGGSAKAAGTLVANQGGRVLEYLFVIEIPSLNGAKALDSPVYSTFKFGD